MALNLNKTHGHDGLSIRMLQMESDSICKPLSIKLLPDNMEEDECCPCPLKGNKQVLNNYRPVSLLPICSKLFEKIIFDTSFQHLMANELLNPNKSGFMPEDSCIHQLISITHEICASFDANPSLKVRGVFLDISKAFDRVFIR